MPGHRVASCECRVRRTQSETGSWEYRHQLKGERKESFAVSVSGNWRITFEFDGENAVDVDLEGYH